MPPLVVAALRLRITMGIPSLPPSHRAESMELAELARAERASFVPLGYATKGARQLGHAPPHDLAELLGRAAAGASDQAQALLGLAALDPRAALAWLLDHEDAARAGCAGDTLGRVVDHVITGLLRLPLTVLPLEVVELLGRYADVAAPETACAVGGALPVERRGAAWRLTLARFLAEAPVHPGLLRLAADAAVTAGDAPAADRLLTRLARAEDSLAMVRHVWRTRAALPPGPGPRVRIALLSSFTVDTLVPYVDLECRTMGLVPDVYIAPFNAWAQEVLAQDSELRRFDPEIAFLAVAIDDLIPELAGTLAAGELDARGATALERVLGVARRFVEWSGGVLVVHGFHSTYRDPQGVLAARAGPSRTAWLAELNARLEERLRALPRAYLLDMADVLLRRSGGPVENPKMRHLAGMRLGDRVLGDVARAYACYIAPLKGLARKCVVVDLDNTLWGGIVGEDGPHGIKLGNTAPGSEYQEFQRYLLGLTERGFLLAVNSKNNPDDALEVIRAHEGMILREAAFSTLRINWRPKPENMVSIAEELSLGLDAMIFLDDNPGERALMRQALPQVLVPDLPPDPSQYRAVVEALPQLQSLVVTEEDRARVARYRQKREREQLREALGSLEHYLHSLGITVEIALATEATLSRVHQLFQRTNQFNLTTRRYEAAQLAAFAQDPRRRLYVLRARDRFGDHGLVATALVRVAPDAWMVDSFLMSCRVIGYGIETALLARISADAQAAGAVELAGEYVETKKSVPARDFYPRHGFTASGSANGVVLWRRPLADHGVLCPAWVRESGSAIPATVAPHGA